MRRGGWFSFIIYILYTLFCGGVAVWLMLAIKGSSENDGSGAFGAAMIMMVFAVMAIGGFIAAILKLLHIASGWVIFVIPCILIDCSFILHSISNTLNIILTGEWDFIFFLPLILAICSLVSNVKSIKN